MDPEKVMSGITNEIHANLKAMAKAKTVEEKLQYSAVVKNLCESLGVFLSFIGDMAPGYGDFEDEDGPLNF